MQTVALVRMESDKFGTFGKLTTPKNQVFWSGELMWLDNKADFSCVPLGKYICKWVDSPKHGWCYQLQNVPSRENIEIHAMNFFGNKDLDATLTCDSLGCIGLGRIISTMGQKCILGSKAAIHAFSVEMAGMDFELIIS